MSRSADSPAARYPLYDERGEQIATIDEELRMRDLRGRFISEDYSMRKALLASCLIAKYGGTHRRPAPDGSDAHL